MNGETLFVLQLIGLIGVGSFVGEFYRLVDSGGAFSRHFIASYLAGSFLSFLVAYGFFLMTNQRSVALFLAGLLAYQDEKYINRISRKLLSGIIKGSEEDDADDT